MKIYPAIDLMDGKVVRLQQGDFAKKTIYMDEPLTVAMTYKNEGAEYLHVIDLDGAKNGASRQFKWLERLAIESGLKLQVGGGIRTRAEAAALIKAGVERVILGSVVVKNPAEAMAIWQELGANHITLGLDVVIDARGIPMMATDGWQKVSDTSAYSLLDKWQELGLNAVLCTDISRDGMLTGPNFELYKQLIIGYPALSFLASGGIASRDDITTARKIGMGGVIIGKALYEGRFHLREVL